MSPAVSPRFSRVALVSLLGVALLSACRDRSASPDSALATDSSLAQDLAMAQRNAPGPLVFNDAPAGTDQPAARTSAIPPAHPAPRRAAAPISRAPRNPASVITAPVASAPASIPAAAGGSIGAGTQLGMTSNGRVCAATALAGDKFTATISSATTGSNGAYIPAGSTVVLEVAAVDRADPIEQSRITFRVRAIDVDGVARAAQGDVATLGALEPVHTSSGNERTKVIGGAVAGAILGRILGGSTRATVIGGAAGAAAGTVAAQRGGSSDACLPNGSAMRLTLSHDLQVPRSGAL